MDSVPRLTDPWMLGPLRVPNRVLLAPLAGIGNWFVRLQAKRYGAGMAVSEMVSSHALHYRNERTHRELLRIDPRERAAGPVSIQLFGSDPEVMRSAAAHVAAAGADAIDLNMGCPVPKVCKTGAGAALLSDPARAVAVARAARAGSGLPVTVKLRSGQRPGETSGFELAQRLVHDAGVCAIAFHPRSAAVHHKGTPDYALAARLAALLPAPVILSGGLREAGAVRTAFAQTGVAAVMLARGCLGNPWLFARLLDRAATDDAPRAATDDAPRAATDDAPRAATDDAPPSVAEVLGELQWLMARAREHLGEQRAARYLRKFYPWYVVHLGLERRALHELQLALQQTDSLAQAWDLLCSGALGSDPEGVDREPADARYTAALAGAATP
jgi:tRNA-dihydrouridine synthase B